MKTVIEHVRQCFAAADLAGVIITAPVDLRYLTGLDLSRGVALITQQEAVLFIDPRFRLVAAQGLPDFEISCHAVSHMMMAAVGLRLHNVGKHVGFDGSTMTVEIFQELASVCLPGQLVSSPAVFSHLRRPKRPEEIEAIAAACSLCEQGFSFLVEEVREGVTELQLSQALKTFWFSHGAEAVSFEPIIAFGEHSACPHWACSSSPLPRHTHLLIDIGVKYRSYHSDMTRTVFFGRPDSRIVECHELVQEAYRLALAAALPGAPAAYVDSVARRYLTAHGYGEAFVHGLGHGVGLEVHEMPRVSASASTEQLLEARDVITIEPGIYLDGVGGVRIENTVVVEPSGARSLMSLPIEPLFL